MTLQKCKQTFRDKKGITKNDVKNEEETTLAQ
jgi:hypothetical protein